MTDWSDHHSGHWVDALVTMVALKLTLWAMFVHIPLKWRTSYKRWKESVDTDVQTQDSKLKLDVPGSILPTKLNIYQRSRRNILFIWSEYESCMALACELRRDRHTALTLFPPHSIDVYNRLRNIYRMLLQCWKSPKHFRRMSSVVLK